MNEAKRGNDNITLSVIWYFFIFPSAMKEISIDGAKDRISVSISIICVNTVAYVGTSFNQRLSNTSTLVFIIITKHS